MITKASHFFLIRFCLIFILGFKAFSASGQGSQWYAHSWQSDDGLPDNYVTGIGQTSDGFLWVATQGGLVRFDGVQFKRLGLPALSGMPIAMIRALIVSKGDKLWLALEGGVVISASPSGTEIFTTADGLPPIRPASMTEDASGAVWVGYWDDSACRIADHTVKRFTSKEGLPYTGFCSLTVDARKQLWFAEGNRIGTFRDGRFLPLVTVPGQACIATRSEGGLWIAADQKLFRYDEQSTLILVSELPRVGGDFEPLTMFEDRSQAVWISTTTSGLYRFNGTNVAHIKTPHGEIRTITEDTEGNIWIGTSGAGLCRLTPRGLDLVGIEQGLPFETVQSVCEDASGNFWVVAQNGLLAHETGGTWQLVNTNHDWTGGPASCVAADKQGGVWIGTVNNGLYQLQNGKYNSYRKTNGLASDRVWTLMTDSEDDVWISLSNPNCIERLHAGTFQKFELPSGSHVVRTLVEDGTHNLWMGTEDGRLLRYDQKSLIDETSRTMTKLVPIRCLQTTEDGALWLGYGGTGVGCLKDGTFSTINIGQGLPDDFISQMAPDDSHRLWFAGNKGIFEVPEPELAAAASGHSKSVQPILFGKNEGLTSLQANFGYGPNSFRAPDGRICFSMLTGLAVVNPGNISVNRQAPPVLIEKVSLNGHELFFPNNNQLLRNELSISNVPEGNQPLELPPQHHEFKIEFNALSFTAPQNVHLRYQLVGYDPQPVETMLRSVTYSQIPPGNYEFKLTACNSSGIWNETGASLHFVVNPFIWQKWWFRTAALLLTVMIIAVVIYYIYVRRLRRQLWRLEQESAVQKDRARIAKDLHDDLGAHLSHIAMLSELAQTDLDKPGQARGHIDQIFRNARLLTRLLDEIVWEVSPKNDTLDRFIGHICQFAPEFLRPAGVRCRFDVPMDLPTHQLEANVRHHLYLGFKESLHNIVKHADASEVWLRLKITRNTVILEVEDNGRGFERRSSVGGRENGLGNLRDRMEEVGGEFMQESQPGRGTRTTLIVPLNVRFK